MATPTTVSLSDELCTSITDIYDRVLVHPFWPV